jgi:hypothetical protein
MAERKASTKSKPGKVTKRERKERRFEPSRTQASRLAVFGGMAGALALGAGVYAQWLRETPLESAPYIVAAGAVALGLALWFSDAGAVPVRVGDAGIAIEKGSEITRLIWCDIKRIFVERGNLVARGEELTLTIPVGAHPLAASWILSEGVRRVPESMDVKRSELRNLPEPRDKDGEVLTIDALQVAGRHCAASEKPIAFERDARLCPNCGQVYHKEHVPKTCVTCQADMVNRAQRA